MAILIDGHLDLAYNVERFDRDLTLELDELRRIERRESQEAMVTLPELRRAGMDIVFATLFVMPRAHADDPAGTYETPEDARALAVAQLELYRRWEEAGLIRLIRDAGDLKAYAMVGEAGGGRGAEGGGEADAGVSSSPSGTAAGITGGTAEHRPLGVVLLMEGAEPLRSPEDLAWWVERGVRIVAPAWKRTRYAAGTGAPGPLSAIGRELIDAIGHHGLVLDVSHLAEEGFWQALELKPPVVIASHSNARAFRDGDRHLSDAMIRAIGERDGAVGLVLASKFLKAGVERGDPKESVTLADVRRQADHVAKLIGWQRVAIGSDFDGGFGRQEVPLELERAADFVRLGEVAPPEQRAGVLGENWLRMLRRAPRLAASGVVAAYRSSVDG